MGQIYGWKTYDLPERDPELDRAYETAKKDFAELCELKDDLEESVKVLIKKQKEVQFHKETFRTLGASELEILQFEKRICEQ